jgi:hypothetical protein
MGGMRGRMGGGTTCDNPFYVASLPFCFSYSLSKNASADSSIERLKVLDNTRGEQLWARFAFLTRQE